MSGPVMFNDAPVRTEAMINLFRTVQRRLLLLTAVVAVVGAGAGALVGRAAGLWGALIAAALGLAFTFTTVALLRWVAGRGPEILQLVLIGGWLLKMVLVVVLMLWLRNEDFYHRGVFFGVLAVAVVGAVVIEIHAVATARLPTVTPAPDVTVVTPDPPVSDVQTPRDRPVPPETAGQGRSGIDQVDQPSSQVDGSTSGTRPDEP